LPVVTSNTDTAARSIAPVIWSITRRPEMSRSSQVTASIIPACATLEAALASVSRDISGRDG
jgi:hypothetical protein